MNRDPNQLHRVVFDPNGTGYEIEAINAFTSAAGSPPLVDVVLMARALLSRRRGEEWEIVVRLTRASSEPVYTTHAAGRRAAERIVEEIAERISSHGLRSGDAD